MKKILLLILLVLGIIFREPLMVHAKTLLLVSEEFPIPAKPLGLITAKPRHQQLLLDSPRGKIVADLFVPNKTTKKPKPALIIAMGVKTSENDKPILLSFTQTISRLGFVVLWPRLEALDQGTSLPEEPGTFIKAFTYLENLKEVNPKRISIIGFSVGSSIALVAAEDPLLADKLRTFIFFGGYYNIFDYVKSLATKSTNFDSQGFPWQPAEGATNHIKEILTTMGAEKLLAIFASQKKDEVEISLQTVPEDEINRFKKYSPKEGIGNFKTPIFILHDKGDNYVPYVESIKLNQALEGKVTKTFLLTNLFEHVQVKKIFSLQMLEELWKLYGFIYQAIDYL